MKKHSRLLLAIGCITIMLAQSATACRLWAVIAQKGYSLSGKGSDNNVLIDEELTTLYHEGAWQPQGWALGYYRNNQIIEGQTVFRSPIRSTQDSLHFFSAVSAILDTSYGTTLAIGHVRTASSGAVPIPDPHPFLFTDKGICYSFVLNGTFDREPFMKLLTKDGKDSSWLMQHPPHTYGNGDWRGDGFTSIVATELYLSWIVKNIAESGDLFSGLAAALVRVYEIIPSSGSRNIIFSDGLRLFVNGGTGHLYYSSAPSTIVFGNSTYSVAHRAVMTEPPTGGAMTWTSVQDSQLVVLAPDTTVIYSYDTLKAISKRSAIITVNNAFYYDNGGDGYIDSIYITAESCVTAERIREIGDSGLIGLPGQRKFIVRKCMPVDSVGFALSVTQDGPATPPITNILPYDMLTAAFHRFAAGGRLIAGDRAIQDRVAPVVVSARARGGAGNAPGEAYDTLRVKFSEPVTIPFNAAPLKPFTFLRRRASDVVEFTPTFSLCTPATAPSDSLSLAVIDFNHPWIKRFMENDSLWIATSAYWIGDTVVPPNYQQNADNSRQAVSLDSIVRNPPREIDPFPGYGVRLRVRAQSSGQVKVAIYSLTGRRMRELTASVKENQWISLLWKESGNKSPFARGILLFTLSLGDMQKRGSIYSTESRQLDVRVGN
jgi:hypothetical protein